MSESFIIPYQDSHVYLGNLRKCVSHLRVELPHMALGNTLELISSAEDAIACADGDGMCKWEKNVRVIDKIKVLRQKHSDNIPALLRNIEVSRDSGLPDVSHLRQFEKFDASPFLKELTKEVGVGTDDTSKIANEARRAILEGREPTNERKLLIWAKFNESLQKFKDIEKEKAQSVTRERANTYNVRYKGYNYLRGGADVATFMQVQIQRKLKFKTVKLKISRPIVHYRRESEECEVDPRLTEVLQTVIGRTPQEIAMVLRAFGKFDQILVPMSVRVETIGPYLFWGNVEYHTFAKYFNKESVSSKEELQKANPTSYAIASIAEEIRNDANLFALFESNTILICDKNKTKTRDRVYGHPDIKFRTAKIKNPDPVDDDDNNGETSESYEFSFKEVKGINRSDAVDQIEEVKQRVVLSK